MGCSLHNKVISAIKDVIYTRILLKLARTHREVINLVDTKWLTNAILLSQIYVAIALRCKSVHHKFYTSSSVR